MYARDTKTHFTSSLTFRAQCLLDTFSTWFLANAFPQSVSLLVCRLVDKIFDRAAQMMTLLLRFAFLTAGFPEKVFF